MEFDLRKHTVLLALAGSRVYGLHTETSDVDVKGVAIAPARYYLGYTRVFEQCDAPTEIEASFFDALTEDEKEVSRREKLEGTVYELRKFLKLAMDCNPNILDVLFCADRHVRLETEAGKELRAHRELFLSAKAKHTFAGYAAAQ